MLSNIINKTGKLYSFNIIKKPDEIKIIGDLYEFEKTTVSNSALVNYYHGLYFWFIKQNKDVAINYFIKAHPENVYASHFIYSYYGWCIILEKTEPKFDEITFLHLWHFRNSEQYPELFKNVVEKCNDHFAKIALFYLELNQFEKAELLLTILNEAKLPIMYSALTVYHLKKGNFEESYKAAEKARELNTNGNQIDMGILLMHEKKFQEAIEYFHKKIDKSTAHCIARCYYGLKDKEKTKEWCLKAIELGETTANMTMAIVLFHNNEQNESLKYFQKAADANIKEAYPYLARLYNTPENRELSKKYYLLAAENGSVDAYYIAGVICVQEKQYHKAHLYFMRLIQNQKETVTQINNMDQYYRQTEPLLKNVADYYIATKNKHPRNRELKQIFENKITSFLLTLKVNTDKCEIMHL